MNLFLQEQDIIDFKKDTCLFCNEKFPTKSKIKYESYRTRDHYEEDVIETTTKIVYISDLNMYHFTLTFPSQEREQIMSTKPIIYEGIVNQVKQQAQQKKEELERTLKLKETEKSLAIQAIVGDILGSIKHSNGNSSQREQLLDAWYRYLFLEDLVSASSSYGGSSIGFNSIKYNPAGLKLHPHCWPYAPVFEDRTERVGYKDFLALLEQTPRLKGYSKKLEEFPELFAMTEDLHIDLKVKRYNPFEFL